MQKCAIFNEEDIFKRKWCIIERMLLHLTSHSSAVCNFKVKAYYNYMVGHCKIYLFALFSTVVKVLKLLLKIFVV